MARHLRHLPRLDQVHTQSPIFFITTCTAQRQPILANDQLHGICREVWENVERYGWRVGKYLLMPDHVHFFCTPGTAVARLDRFVGKWKEWTSKYWRRQTGLGPGLWETEFFDHLLRSLESYEQKCEYVANNPVRAGLVASSDAWPYQGEMHRLRFD